MEFRRSVFLFLVVAIFGGLAALSFASFIVGL